MGLIDFILNLAALLLWLSWRSMYFDPLTKTMPVTLVGTLKRAEPHQLKGWQFGAAICLILSLRGLMYWLIGSPADWTPKLDLGLVSLAFRSDFFGAASIYSVLSFLRCFVVFYFWLFALAVINRNHAEADPIQKLVRLHLGATAHWRWPAQLLLPFVIASCLWIALEPLVAYLGVISPVRSTAHLLGQGFLVGLGLCFSLKYVLPAVLVLHLVSSYVYLGSNPFWDFVTTTARNLLAPLRRIPLRLAKVDFAPVAGVILVFLLLHWLPNFVLGKMAEAKLSPWPQ